MKLLSVYPIVPLPQHMCEPFSYFSNEDLAPGAFVWITFRNKKVAAIIETAENLQAKKLDLKKMSFRIKKITGVISKTFLFHPAFYTAIRIISSDAIEPLGATMKLFISAPLFEKQPPSSLVSSSDTPFSDQRSEIIVGSLAERISFYKNEIRSLLAQKKSAVIFLPTARMAEYFADKFSDLPKGVIFFHGQQQKKKILETREYYQTSARPQLLITTALGLSLLKGDEGLIVIEDADSPHWRPIQNPQLEMARAIKIFANEIQARSIEGKYLPSIQDLSLEAPTNYLAPRHKRQKSPVIIDMSQEPNRAEYPLVSGSLCESIEKNQCLTLVFTARKGFYSFVVCRDCGKFLTCQACGKQLVLHARKHRYYTCRSCQKEYSSEMPCPQCGSWNLKGYGVGTERIYKEIKKRFSKRALWMYDDEVIKNKGDQENTIKNFLESGNGILIGTEKILEEPRLAADEVHVAHIDNLFSIPDFQIHEEILIKLQKLKERGTGGGMIIQTRFPTHPLFQYFLDGNIKHFLLNELEERRQADLPPFTTLIKVTPRYKNAEKMSAVKHFFAGKNKFIYEIGKESILVALARSEWLKNVGSVRQFLKEATKDFEIAINPKTIL